MVNVVGATNKARSHKYQESNKNWNGSFLKINPRNAPERAIFGKCTVQSDIDGINLVNSYWTSHPWQKFYLLSEHHQFENSFIYLILLLLETHSLDMYVYLSFIPTGGFANLWIKSLDMISLSILRSVCLNLANLSVSPETKPLIFSFERWLILASHACLILSLSLWNWFWQNINRGFFVQTNCPGASGVLPYWESLLQTG